MGFAGFSGFDPAESRFAAGRFSRIDPARSRVVTACFGGFDATGSRFGTFGLAGARFGNSASFSARVSRLIAASRLSAALRSAAGSWNTTRTGRRDLVYAAPFPAACLANLRSRSFVQPV